MEAPASSVLDVSDELGALFGKSWFSEVCTQSKAGAGDAWFCQHLSSPLPGSEIHQRLCHLVPYLGLPCICRYDILVCF